MHNSQNDNSAIARHINRVIALRRAPRYSPNNVDNDLQILQMVAERVGREIGATVPVIDEEDFCKNPVDADLYLSMAREPHTLAILSGKELEGRCVINPTPGVRLCSHRALLDTLMRQWGIHMPPLTGDYGYWLKRGDSVTQSDTDVVYCPDAKALEMMTKSFERRGIKEAVISTHIVGDVIKFYGVGDTMFHYYYYSDKGISKFGKERINGVAHHYPFDTDAFRREVQSLSRHANVPVFGGDAIVDKTGNYFIIDFNDWPTFSNCREEAVEAIVKYISYVNI